MNIAPFRAINFLRCVIAYILAMKNQTINRYRKKIKV